MELPAISIGKPDKLDRRCVTASRNGDQWSDKIDVAVANDRQKFAAAAFKKLRLEEVCDPDQEGDLLAAIDAEILAAAKSDDDLSTRAPILRRLSDVKPQAVRWLWPGRFAIGKLTLVAGDPGLGKSFLTCAMAATVSRGAPWPDSPDKPQPAGGVVMLSAEDDLEDTIRPRLDAHEADVTKITAIEAIKYVDRETGRESRDSFNLQMDLPHLEDAIKQTPNCRLVVIDPITAYCGSTDSHKNADVRGLLAPLGELAARHGVAVVGVTHLNKAGAGPAIYRAQGSLAFVAAARAVHGVMKDKDDPRRRLFLPVKNNLAADTGGLAFTLEKYGFDQSPIVCWEAGTVDVTADEAMAIDHDEEGGAIGEAIDWLQQHLANGPSPAKQVKKAARADGIAPRTLDRAKKKIGVVAKRDGSDGAWTWRLKNANYSPSQNNGALGVLGNLDHEERQERQERQAAKSANSSADNGDYSVVEAADDW